MQGNELLLQYYEQFRLDPEHRLWRQPVHHQLGSRRRGARLPELGHWDIHSPGHGRNVDGHRVVVALKTHRVSPPVGPNSAWPASGPAYGRAVSRSASPGMTATHLLRTLPRRVAGSAISLEM